MDVLELATADPGYYLVRSASTTVYILDLASPHPRMMRSTVPGSSSSRSWWDDQWAPLVAVESRPEGGRGAIAVGSRARWVADPGGRTDANEWWWISRQVTSIEQVSAAELEGFLAGRGSSPDHAGEEAGGLAETDAIMGAPETVASIQEGLDALEAGDVYTAEEVRAALTLRAAMADRRRRNQARRRHLLAEMTGNAVEDGLYDAGAADYTQALCRARGKSPGKEPRQRDSELTEQANAAIEKSGQDDDDLAWVTEMSRQFLRGLSDSWDDPPEPRAIRAVVAELITQIGATQVVALSAAASPEDPHDWKAGDARPNKAAETRLRAAYAVWNLLAAEESGDVARAFFVASNPALGDASPVIALREGRTEEVYAAVRAFLTDGWTG